MNPLFRWLHTPMTVCTGWEGPHRQTVIRFGNPFVPKSHGMCAACSAAWERRAQRDLAVWQALRAGRDIW